MPGDARAPDSRHQTELGIDQSLPDGNDPRTCKNTPSADENDWIEAKNERCCNGLVFIDIAYPGDGGSCQYPAPPSAMLCAFCGDGVCNPPENRCNCGADCK